MYVHTSTYNRDSSPDDALNSVFTWPSKQQELCKLKIDNVRRHNHKTRQPPDILNNMKTNYKLIVDRLGSIELIAHIIRADM